MTTYDDWLVIPAYGSDDVKKIMGVVNQFVDSWNAAWKDVPGDFKRCREIQPLRDLLIIYGNGSGESPYSIMNVKERK